MHDYVTVPNFTFYWERKDKLRQHLSSFFFSWIKGFDTFLKNSTPKNWQRLKRRRRRRRRRRRSIIKFEAAQIHFLSQCDVFVNVAVVVAFAPSSLCELRGLLNVLKHIRRPLTGKFQKASNLIHLYDPRMAQYQMKVSNQSTTSSQIHPPSTGYIRSTIHYQSYRILKENQVNKAGVILLEWSFHCIQLNGINGKTFYTTVIHKTTKIEKKSGRVCG